MSLVTMKKLQLICIRWKLFLNWNTNDYLVIILRKQRDGDEYQQLRLDGF